MDRTYGEMAVTSIGPLSFMAGDKGLEKVAFLPLNTLKDMLENNTKTPSLKGFETINNLLTEINAYLHGLLRSFTAEINWDVVAPYQRTVLELVSTIPYGEYMTYGEVATTLGNSKAARAVGHALAANPMPILIPCHRVVSADHKLHGYLGGVEIKAFLLALEGHQVIDHRLKIAK